MNPDQPRLDAAAQALAEGDSAAAIQICRRILRAEGSNSDAMHLLGVSLASVRDPAAHTWLSAALKARPNQRSWRGDFAVALTIAGEWKQALRQAQKLLKVSPDDTRAKVVRAYSLRHLEKLPEAFRAFTVAAEATAQAHLWSEAARLALLLERYTDAQTAARQAIKFEADNRPAHDVLADVCTARGEYQDEVVQLKTVLRLAPRDPLAMGRLAAALYRVGEMRASLRLLTRAEKIREDWAMAAGRLHALIHLDVSSALIRRQNVLWSERYGSSQHPLLPGIAPQTTRRINLAYLSGEPALSPGNFVLRPLFRSHDRTRFRIRVYAHHPTWKKQADSMGLHPHELIDISSLTPQQIAQRVRDDGNAIAVDVSGHYGGGLLRAMALRTAPVQMSFPNYPSTTGLRTMDYVITDRWTTPEGSEAQYTEKPCRIPSGYLCFEHPRRPHVRVGPPPHAANGFITFGLFQRPAKLNVDLWRAIARILSSVPHARLLIHHDSADLERSGSSIRELIAGALKPHEIAPDRLLFRQKCSIEDHLRAVALADIALDTFPYSGQTTTFDCLWMGVPVVTLVGKRHASRVSAGILQRAGLGEWVAADVDAYVRTATEKATDRENLAAVRSTLRRRLLRSSVMNADAVTRSYEAEFERIWRTYTAASTPPGST